MCLVFGSCVAGQYFSQGSCYDVPAGAIDVFCYSVLFLTLVGKGFYNPWPFSQMYYICPSGTFSGGGAATCTQCSSSVAPGAAICEPPAEEIVECGTGSVSINESCWSVPSGILVVAERVTGIESTINFRLLQSI